MKFKNPANNYIEERSVPWLWAFFFGGFYFLLSGLWVHVVFYMVLSSILFLLDPPAVLLMVFVNIGYVIAADGIIRNSYLQKGWVEIKDPNEGSNSADYVYPYVYDEATGQRKRVPKPKVDPPPSEYRKCPFCAEEIRSEAIKCKHCGSEIAPLTPAESSPNL